MGRIAKKLTELIGNTPLLELSGYCEALKLNAVILAKLESFNPTGSSKDRAALFMLNEAERQGFLQKGTVIIEPTSGNTGIGLASIAAARGYRLILTMPDTMSEERRSLLRAYGAELVLTDGAKGMTGAVEKSRELAEQLPDVFLPSQFDNLANPDAHRRTTGPEIWEDTDGKVDIFVAGVGSGGTITGVGAYLKDMNSAIRIMAVEPYESSVLSGNPAGSHRIQGIGAGFVPSILDRSVIDEILRIKSADAISTCRTLARSEGLLAGVSSGAALVAATDLARRKENEGKVIVVLLPDTGERYLSLSGFID